MPQITNQRMRSHLQERDLQGKSHSYTSSLKGYDSLRLRNLHLIELQNHQWMNFHLQRKKKLRVIIIKIIKKTILARNFLISGRTSPTDKEFWHSETGVILEYPFSMGFRSRHHFCPERPVSLSNSYFRSRGLFTGNKEFTF